MSSFNQHSNGAATIQMRTGAWYGDSQLEIPVPNNWDVSVLNPQTPPPLTDAQILQALLNPYGYDSFADICEGKSRPLLIVDDLNRPTPVDRIMPFLLSCFEAHGIPAEDITIILATGTHGTPPAGSIEKKVGKEAAAKCRLVVHDCFKDVKKIAKTDFGTPVFVNKALLDCDLVIGIGGIYPNHTAGFGGGTKLALGILGIRSIYHLHFRHKTAGWGNGNLHNGFRQELNKVAEIIGLKTNIAMHIDAGRNVIQLYCGKFQEYFNEAVDYYCKIYQLPFDNSADVVISNTYPNDLSLLFARTKGFIPFHGLAPDVSRIAIAACPEGVGLHNIFPFVNIPRFFKLRHTMLRLSVMSAGEFFVKGKAAIKKIYRRLKSKIIPTSGATGSSVKTNPVWLFQSAPDENPLPASIPGIHVRRYWSDILNAVENEQGKRTRLKVLVYPCAFLQFYDKNSNEDHRDKSTREGIVQKSH